MDALTRDVEALIEEVRLAHGGEFTPWGKCDRNPIRIALPPEVKRLLAERAAAQGMTVSEYGRLIILVALYGRDEVKRRFSEVLDGMAD